MHCDDANMYVATRCGDTLCRYLPATRVDLTPKGEFKVPHMYVEGYNIIAIMASLTVGDGLVPGIVMLKGGSPLYITEGP